MSVTRFFKGAAKEVQAHKKHETPCLLQAFFAESGKHALYGVARLRPCHIATAPIILCGAAKMGGTAQIFGVIDVAQRGRKTDAPPAQIGQRVGQRMRA